MSKKLIAVFVTLLLVLTSSFATVYDYNPEQETFSLNEVYVVNGPLFSADVIQFMQVYEGTEEPVKYYWNASQFSDEKIEEIFYYYLSFMAPQAAGYIPFIYMADLEEYAKASGVTMEENQYSFEPTFTTMAELGLIYPAGMIRTSAYDTFRTTARHLAAYAAVNGQGPSTETCFEYLVYAYQQYLAEYEAAMEAEAAAAAEAEPAEATPAATN